MLCMLQPLCVDSDPGPRRLFGVFQPICLHPSKTGPTLWHVVRWLGAILCDVDLLKAIEFSCKSCWIKTAPRRIDITYPTPSPLGLLVYNSPRVKFTSWAH